MDEHWLDPMNPFQVFRKFLPLHFKVEEYYRLTLERRLWGIITDLIYISFLENVSQQIKLLLEQCITTVHFNVEITDVA